MRHSLIRTVSGWKADSYHTPRKPGLYDPSSSMASTASFSDLSDESRAYPGLEGEVGVVSGKPTRRRCTSREGALVSGVVALLLLTGVLIALVATFSNPCRHQPGTGCKPDPPQTAAVVAPGETPCVTSSCVSLASRVVSSIDHQAAPCDDFFQYACANFGTGAALPVTSGVMDAYTLATSNNLQRVRMVLEEAGTAVNGLDSAAARKTKTYYNSCLNLKSLDQHGNVAALKLIRDLGSWPLTTDTVSGRFDSATFDLEERLSRAFRFRSFPIMLLEVEPDILGTRQGSAVLQFGPGSLGLQSASELIKPNSRHEHDVYVTFFKTVTSSLGANPIAAAKMAERMWTLNEAIARITPANILNNLDRPTLAQLSWKLREYVDVSRLVQLTFGADMPETEKVLVLGKDYFTYLGTVLSQADNGLFATYITWQVLVTMAPYLNADIRDAEQQVQVALYGYSAQPPPRWEVCVRRTSSLFPSVVDALFVQRFYPASAKEEGEVILGFLQQELLSQLPHIPWMDNRTLEQAEDKLEALRHRVGYPITSPTTLERSWAHIMPLSELDELYNVRLLRQANFRREFQYRTTAGNTSWWDEAATETLATYDRFANRLVFTAGLFQYPFFDTSFPRAMKFGALGTVMAQETVHVVDGQGRYYDANGAYNDWWSPKVVKAFTRRVRCFSEGMDNVKVDALDMAEKLVSDSGSLRLAYKVYEDFMSEQGGAETHTVLPAVNLTEPQLFFLSYAQRFCVKDHGLPVSGGGTAEDANHYRVTTSLRNSADFSAAFKCPTGSAMNPEVKCSIW